MATHKIRFKRFRRYARHIRFITSRIANCTEIRANFCSWCDRERIFFDPNSYRKFSKFFAARSTKRDTLRRRNPRSISVFQTWMDDKSNDYCGSNVCSNAVVLREIRLKGGIVFSPLLIDPSASRTRNVFPTQRAHKSHPWNLLTPSPEFTQELPRSCKLVRARREGARIRWRMKEGWIVRLTRTGNARIKVLFIFHDIVAREIWTAETSRCVKTYRGWS